MAREQKRFGLLRGWNPENGSHGGSRSIRDVGTPFFPAVHYPCYGSVVSYQSRLQNAMPPFVQLGEHRQAIWRWVAGVLGLEHGAFEVLADPTRIHSVSETSHRRQALPPTGRPPESILAKIDELQRQAELQPAAYEALDEHYKNGAQHDHVARNQAGLCDRTRVRQASRCYGRHRFGQSCLLARRLIESGVRFVTVTMEDGIPIKTTSKPLGTVVCPRGSGLAAVADRS